MTVKTTKFDRKPAQNAPLSLPSPSRTTMRVKEPEYALILRKLGFIRPGEQRDAWGLWQLVTADPVVAAMSAKLDAKRPWLMRSSASINIHAKKILQQMTPAQRAALKLRLGLSQ